jgi:hypothetical protein
VANSLDIPGQPDGIHDDSRDLPVASKAIPRIRAYVTEFGDGLYDSINGAPLYGRDLEAVCRQLDQLSGWLIWSRYHNAWWKAEERGYTTDMLCAGRYQKDDAVRIAGVRKMDDGSPGEVVVAAPEPEMFGLPNLMERMRARISAATRAANVARSAQEE